jgi:haloalkane dehalogenase
MTTTASIQPTDCKGTGGEGLPAGSGSVLPGVRPEWLTPELFPFRSRWLELDGSLIHYVDEGAGPTLLMLHAAPAWSFIYRRWIAALSDTFRCIAFDYPGFGLSSPVPGQETTLANLSGTVRGFVRKLDLREIILAVHDASGPVGFTAAEAEPERIRGLIIADSFAWPLREYPHVRQMLRLVSSPAGSWLNARFRLLTRGVARGFPRKNNLTPAERQMYVRAFPAASLYRITRLFGELAHNEAHLRGAENALAKLRDRPALLMYGEHDPARLAGWQMRFERILPQCHSVVILGEGHFPHEGAPEAMVQAIRTWWKEAEWTR